MSAEQPLSRKCCPKCPSKGEAAVEAAGGFPGNGLSLAGTFTEQTAGFSASRRVISIFSFAGAPWVCCRSGSLPGSMFTVAVCQGDRVHQNRLLGVSV